MPRSFQTGPHSSWRLCRVAQSRSTEVDTSAKIARPSEWIVLGAAPELAGGNGIGQRRVAQHIDEIPRRDETLIVLTRDFVEARARNAATTGTGSRFSPEIDVAA